MSESTQPLLADELGEDFFVNEMQRRKSKPWKPVLVLFFIVVTAVVVALNVIFVAPHAQEYVNQAVEFNVKDVSFDKVTSQGFQVNVTGVNSVNYGNIESQYCSKLFSFGAGILKSANIRLQNSEIEYYDNSSHSKRSLGYIVVPPFELDLVEATDVVLPVTVVPHNKEVLRLLKTLVLHPDELVTFLGQAVVAVSLGYLPSFKFSLDMHQAFSRHQAVSDTELSMDFVTIDEVDEGFGVSVQASVKNPVYGKSLGFKVPSLDWNILLPNCNSEPNIDFGHRFSSQEIVVSSADERLYIGIDSIVTSLPKALFQTCPSNKTLLDTYLERLLRNESVPIVVTGSTDNGENPLSELLSRLKVPLSIDLPFVDTSDMMKNISLNNLQLGLSEDGYAMINCDIEAIVSPPEGIKTLDIQDIRGLVNISYLEQQVVRVPIDNWIPCETTRNNTDLVLKFSIHDQLVDVLDSGVLRSVINQLLFHSKVPLSFNGLLDVKVDTKLGQFVISGLPGHGETEITKTLFR